MTWADVTLGDLLRVEHGFAFKGEHFSDNGRLVVLTPGNFHETGGFRPRPGKDRFYTARFPERYLLRKNSLIVAMTEQGEGLLGSAALIPEESTYLHNQRLGLVTEDKQRADRRFLYYLFNSESVRQQIRNSSSGAKVRHTSPERIYGVEVRVPEKTDEQQKIAAILSAYDDLIENNRRRIALLEKMAEEIYREWFVRLRFPGHEQAKFEKGVPTDWSYGELSDIAVESSRSAQPGNHLADRRYVPLDLLASREMIPVDHEDFSEAQSSLVTFEEDDILFGAMRPYLHKVALAPFKGITRTTCFVIRPKTSGSHAFLFLTLFQQSSIDYASMICNGADRPYVVWNRGMEKMGILLPDAATLERFETAVGSILERVKRSYFLLRHLRASRDALLPRLISGKLPVDALDIHFPSSMQLE